MKNSWWEWQFDAVEVEASWDLWKASSIMNFPRLILQAVNKTIVTVFRDETASADRTDACAAFEFIRWSLICMRSVRHTVPKIENKTDDIYRSVVRLSWVVSQMFVLLYTFWRNKKQIYSHFVASKPK